MATEPFTPRSTPDAAAARSADTGEDLIVLRDLVIERGRGAEIFVVEVPELRISRGSFTALLGPSGCGKTSLLMVLGLLRGSAQDGEFRIRCGELSYHLAEALPGFADRTVTVFSEVDGTGGGRRLSGRPLEELRGRLLGFCLQGGELVPSLSLAENVAVPAHLCRHREPADRAAASLAALDMSGQLGKLPGELSGGQSQRGVLARSLVHHPPLVILDEPTSSLDRRTAEGAIALLRRRARARGQTVLMVTHDPVLARRFADHVLEMDVTGERRGGVVRRKAPEREGEEEAPAGEVPGENAGGPPEDPGPERFEAVAPPGGRRGDKHPRALHHGRGPRGGLLVPRARGEGEAGSSRLSRLRRRSTYAFPAQLVKNALIAVAIGLLILLLRGIRSGLVEEFRRDLLASPTARELVITPLMATGGLSAASLDALAEEHPEIDLILPQSTHVVSLADPPTDEASLTLVGTLPEDPKLAVVYRDQDFSGFTRDTLVVSSALAEERGLTVGAPLPIWVTRDLDADGRRRETRRTTLSVSNVLEGGDRRTAYAHLDLMRQIGDYKAGRPVAERGWGGFASPAAPRYAAFLLFARRPLSGREERLLSSRGLVAEALDGADARSALHGRFREREELAAEGKPEIHAYAVLSGRQEEDLRWLDPGLAEVGDLLVDSDAILLPWNEPLPATLDGRGVTLVGLAASTRWLKGYLVHRRGVFPAGETGWRLAFADRSDDTQPALLEVDLGGGALSLPVDLHGAAPAAADGGAPATEGTAPDEAAPAAEQVGLAEEGAPEEAGGNASAASTGREPPPAGAPASATPAAATGSLAPATPGAAAANRTEDAAAGDGRPVAVVPAAFLAHLHMAGAGLAVPDLGQRLFRPARDEVTFYQARVFVRDVFQVADLHQRLAERFGVRSNQARVREVQRYSGVLDLLVRVLSVMALIIAFLTIYLVFHEVSTSKKRMLGTLRVMGLSRKGVVVLLLVRGLLVAAVAGALIVLAGQGLSAALNVLYGETLCLLSLRDYLEVVLAIVGVCLLAVGWPAWQVSGLDPVAALEEAKLAA